jgi:hypothetical protein
VLLIFSYKRAISHSQILPAKWHSNPVLYHYSLAPRLDFVFAPFRFHFSNKSLSIKNECLWMRIDLMEKCWANAPASVVDYDNKSDISKLLLWKPKLCVYEFRCLSGCVWRDNSRTEAPIELKPMPIFFICLPSELIRLWGQYVSYFGYLPYEFTPNFAFFRVFSNKIWKISDMTTSDIESHDVKIKKEKKDTSHVVSNLGKAK